MTKLKIGGALPAQARAALEPHVAALYARPGVRRMIVGELHHVERTQPAPDGESEPSVTMRLSAVEVVPDDHEGIVRELMSSMYVERTARGTLTEEDELQLAQSTIEATAGLYSHVQVARLAAGIRLALDYAARVIASEKLTASELRHELDAIRTQLGKVLSGGHGREDEAGEVDE